MCRDIHATSGKDGNGKDGNGKDGNGKDGNGKDGNGQAGAGRDARTMLRHRGISPCGTSSAVSA